MEAAAPLELALLNQSAAPPLELALVSSQSVQAISGPAARLHAQALFRVGAPLLSCRRRKRSD